jgi:hypothetical protein
MNIIPLHLQRRFEQRWAAQFGSLIIPAVPKNVGLKVRHTLTPCSAKAKKNPAGGVGGPAGLATGLVYR